MQLSQNSLIVYRMLNQTDMLHQMESKSAFFIRLAGICGCSKWGFAVLWQTGRSSKSAVGWCIGLREWFVCLLAPRASQKLSQFECLSRHYGMSRPARWSFSARLCRDHPSMSSVSWTYSIEIFFLFLCVREC